MSLSCCLSKHNTSVILLYGLRILSKLICSQRALFVVFVLGRANSDSGIYSYIKMASIHL